MFDKEEHVLSNVVRLIFKAKWKLCFHSQLMGRCSHKQRSGHAILFVLLLFHVFPRSAVTFLGRNYSDFYVILT